jgi:hypothetical protein
MKNQTEIFENFCKEKYFMNNNQQLLDCRILKYNLIKLEKELNIPINIFSFGPTKKDKLELNISNNDCN